MKKFIILFALIVTVVQSNSMDYQKSYWKFRETVDIKSYQDIGLILFEDKLVQIDLNNPHNSEQNIFTKESGRFEELFISDDGSTILIIGRNQNDNREANYSFDFGNSWKKLVHEDYLQRYFLVEPGSFYFFTYTSTNGIKLHFINQEGKKLISSGITSTGFLHKMKNTINISTPYGNYELDNTTGEWEYTPVFRGDQLAYFTTDSNDILVTSSCSHGSESPRGIFWVLDDNRVDLVKFFDCNQTFWDADFNGKLLALLSYDSTYILSDLGSNFVFKFKNEVDLFNDFREIEITDKGWLLMQNSDGRMMVYKPVSSVNETPNVIVQPDGYIVEGSFSVNTQVEHFDYLGRVLNKNIEYSILNNGNMFLPKKINSYPVLLKITDGIDVFFIKLN